MEGKGLRFGGWPRLLLTMGLAFALALTVNSSRPAGPPPPAEAFGTINSLGQRSEHERTTRASLACPMGTLSSGDCFEPNSIDQVAGKPGTFGAVGAPDLDEFFTTAAHCDDADFMNVPGYPRTRAEATADLLACLAYMRGRFTESINASNDLVDGVGGIIPAEIDLTIDCTFTFSIPGRAKCNAFNGFGRALHTAQDFYSHSNWADEADPSRPIGINNPPGLNRPGPSSFLDLAGTSTPAIPVDLTTGFFAGPVIDFCPGFSRVTHACLQKDKALIDPVTGVVSDPQTPRGMVLSRAQKAVTGAIAETRRQWSDFSGRLLSTYGNLRGGCMILALTQDVPRNIRPKVDAGPDAVIKKGATFSSAGSFTDLCSPSWTATVDYGDGSGAQPLPLNANMTFGLSHVYANDGLYAVTVRVTDNGGLTGSDMALVLVDGTLPACSLTAVIAGPPKQLQITGRDAGSGLQSIVVLQSTNADTVVPPFVAGTTGPVVVTATKIDQTFGSIVRLRVIDRAGNATECDPVATLVVREAGMPVSQTFGGIPQAESQVTIMNGSPGVTNLQVGVNGKRFAVAELKDGESRTIDVSSAMVAGNDNTVTLEARGRPGGGADVVIHD